MASNFAVLEVDASDPRVPELYVIAFRLSRALAVQWADILGEINRVERKRLHVRYAYHVVDLAADLPRTIDVAGSDEKWQIPAAGELASIVFDEEVINDAIVTYPDAIVTRCPKPERKAKLRDFFNTVRAIQALKEQADSATEVSTKHDKATRLRSLSAPASDDDSESDDSSSSSDDDSGAGSGSAGSGSAEGSDSEGAIEPE
jgi:hypothetical protein